MRRRILSIFALAFCMFPMVSLAQEIYRVGQVEVRIYDDPKKLWKDLPAHVQATYEAMDRALNQDVIIRGFSDSPHGRIYSVKDWCVLMHEFKHYLEPEWSHDLFGDKPPCEEFRVK